MGILVVLLFVVSLALWGLRLTGGTGVGGGDAGGE